MKYRCRMLDQPETEREVASDEATYAPDHYVHENVRADVAGIAFVEVLDPNGPCPAADGWQLWRVELCASGVYITAPIVLADARAEMAKWQENAS